MSARPVRRSLAGAFTPAAAPRDRAAGLGGLLPPKPDPDTSPAERMTPLTAVTDDGLDRLPAEQPVRVGEGEEEHSSAAEPLAGGSELDDRVRNVAVYLPVDLLDRLKRTRRSRELTYSDLLVEAAAAHLGDVEPAFRAAPPRAVSGMPSRVRRGLSGPGVQVQIRLDGHQLRWLDQQVARLGAPSRTALVFALFERHLT